MESLISNHLPEIKNLFKTDDIDLIAEETLSHRFSLEALIKVKFN